MSPLHSLFRGSLSALSEVGATHCHAIKSAAIFDVYVANRILNSYLKCRDIIAAVELFEEIPNRDTVTSNTMIAGYVNFGMLVSAWGCVICMKRNGVILDGHTFGSMLKGVGFGNCVSWGQLLHADIMKMGYEGNVYCGSVLLDMYAKCGRFEDARRIFYCMPERNVVSWNSMVSACAERGGVEFCFELVKCMEGDGLRVDDGTFAPILPLLDDCKFYELTMQVHAKMEKTGLCFYNTVFNALTTAYSGCGYVGDAERVFYSGNGVLDLVSWNSMLAAYVEDGQQLLAFRLFSEMEMLGWEPDVFTYTTIVTAVPDGAERSLGKPLHALVIKRGLAQLTPISNSLAAMYMGENNNSNVDAVKIFQYTELRDIVSWNTALTALSQSGLSEDALKLFLQMHSESLEVDHYSFSASLRSCSDLATLRLGQQIHVLAIRLGLESNKYVTSALIFMYSKCGIIEDAWRSFEASSRDSSIIWNSIMFAYAQHGQGQVALDLFHIMDEVKVKPDHITFVAALMACSHTGLVKEGHNLLKSMESEHGIPPRAEHYACAIDLFGRAGRLQEAKELVNEMPFKPDAMVWRTLLGACRMCGDIDFANKVAGHLLESEPQEHCTYVLLSDMYGYFKNWKEIAKLKILMKERGVKKVPGWSWIEIKNEVHAFNAEDHSHPHCKEIYNILSHMMDEIKISENSANFVSQTAYMDPL